jgi:predicted dehydrogenase
MQQRKKGVLLIVNQSQRRNPEHRKAKEVVDSGIFR